MASSQQIEPRIEEYIREVNEKIWRETNDKLDNFKKKQSTIEKNIQDLSRLSDEYSEASEKYKKDLKEYSSARKDIISTLGILTAVFAFLVVEFSIFNTVGNFAAALGQSLVLLGSLLLFALFLRLPMSTLKMENWLSSLKVYWLPLVLILVGSCIVVFWGQSKQERVCAQAIQYLDPDPQWLWENCNVRIRLPNEDLPARSLERVQQNSSR
ncbi:hypothetical protein LRY60_05905 [Candidatus Woesebacteria bacterium]|nr:hypothetical protein [Candidatus Woesebacteria bacterium]MCD8507362.1 hypothetical protein [Candidatus Woesebacteria bacterium]MCD8546794.1 hypothetical protein [Candidatus Woesebacteria bacterium]